MKASTLTFEDRETYICTWELQSLVPRRPADHCRHPAQNGRLCITRLPCCLLLHPHCNVCIIGGMLAASAAASNKASQRCRLHVTGGQAWRPGSIRLHGSWQAGASREVAAGLTGFEGSHTSRHMCEAAHSSRLCESLPAHPPNALLQRVALPQQHVALPTQALQVLAHALDVLQSVRTHAL